MTLQTSGAISLGDMGTEFSDTQPHSMSEFYSGGSIVSSSYSFTGTASGLSIPSSSFGSRGGYDRGPGINSSTELYYHVRWCDGCSQSATIEFTIDNAGTYIFRMGGFLQAGGQYTDNEIWVNGTKIHDFTVPYSVYGTNEEDKTVTVSAGASIKLVVYMSALGNTWQSTNAYVYGSTAGSKTVSASGNDNVPTSGEISISDFYGAVEI
jgi:hypothetical protein